MMSLTDCISLVSSYPSPQVEDPNIMDMQAVSYDVFSALAYRKHAYDKMVVLCH